MIGLLESCRVFLKEFGDHCRKNPGDFKFFFLVLYTYSKGR